MAEFETVFFRSGLLLWCLLSGSAFGLEKDVPPQIVKPVSQVQQIVDVYKRQYYTVECSARGDPQPTFQWKRDDQLLDETQESIKAFENGVLYFKNFSDKENGVYQCLATNKYGTSVSVKLPLVNKKIPEKRILRFVYVKPEDSKIYTCGLVPSILDPHDEIRMFNSVELKVSPISELLDASPQIQFKRENVKVLVGKSVTLECFFSGKPVPNISWISNRNEDIKPDSRRFRIDDFGRKLTIIKVEENDEGIFSCTAKNGVGSQAIEHINVNVTSPPMKILHQGLRSLVKPDRYDITLKCKARAAKHENLNIPVWYKNGVLLKEANLPERYKFNKDHTELHIRNPDKLIDTACFQCNISNSEGYAFYDGYLKVIDSIRITRRPEENIEISRENIDISVHADGDSCCKIVQQWFHNGVRLTPEQLDKPPFKRDQTKDILLFDPRSVSNETLTSILGNYTCRVSNAYDFQEVKFHIYMKGEVKFHIYTKDVPIVIAKTAPEVPTTASVGFELWWEALICGFLILVIIIEVIVIIVIVKTNYLKKPIHISGCV